MKRFKKADGTEIEVGVSSSLIKEYGTLQKVMESRIEIEKFRALASKQYEETVAQILDAPKNTLNWEHNIATLIGTARAHKANRDMYTIKEKS